MVNIEINGKPLEVREGAMVIEVADEAGITIPRFCYHKKLSIAANCRMCLVEVEKAPKPLPACATPVADGMKIFTRSPKALAAQKGVMEFLLINHPLDCPICDQGGECDLQEMAMGFGQDVSRFAEKKRVVKDKNLGALIATDMTRCIHCTRCVRFGQEVAGIREIGATGRGEHMEIGTYIEKSVDSELSGNIIDLCPVGALTSKPFRYSARPWELNDRPSIAPHDCIGSNIFIQTRRSSVMRVIPRENESINETWISDRDRFSYEALNSNQRLSQPLIKENDQWQITDWNTALEFIVKSLNGLRDKEGAEQIASLISPSSTVEELYLMQKLMRAIGSNNIDHRLAQNDFRDQDIAPIYPGLGTGLEDLEKQQAIFLLGSNLRKEQAIAAVRVRKAALSGAKVMCVNSIDHEFNFPVMASLISRDSESVKHLAAIAKSLLHITGETAPDGLVALLENIDSHDIHLQMAETLNSAKKAIVLLGSAAQSSTYLTEMRALAGLIAQLSSSRIAYLTEGANSAGAWLAGAVPHRSSGGSVVDTGLDASAMFNEPRKAYMLFGVEPELEAANPSRAISALNNAEFVVAINSFESDAMREYASVMLPITPFSETSGTYVNAEGTWQSFKGAVPALHEARPGWKVLRVMGNLFDVEGFDYMSSEEVRDELKSQTAECVMNEYQWRCPESLNFSEQGLQRVGLRPIYSIDGLVRRAENLQNTHDAGSAAIYINHKEAARLGVDEGLYLSARQGLCAVTLPVVIDDKVADGCAYIPAGMEETRALGASFGKVELTQGG